jgi:hypothetical protein
LALTVAWQPAMMVTLKYVCAADVRGAALIA